MNWLYDRAPISVHRYNDINEFSWIVDFTTPLRSFEKKPPKPVETIVRNKTSWSDLVEKYGPEFMRGPSLGNTMDAVKKESPKRLTLIDRHNIAVKKSKAPKPGNVSKIRVKNMTGAPNELCTQRLLVQYYFWDRFDRGRVNLFLKVYVVYKIVIGRFRKNIDQHLNNNWTQR